MYHSNDSVDSSCCVITVKIDVAEMKKYIVPLVAAATRGCTLFISSTGTITSPAPAPSIPAKKPAPKPFCLSLKLY